MKAFLSKALPKRFKKTKFHSSKTEKKIISINSVNTSSKILSFASENSSVVLESLSPISPEENGETNNNQVLDFAVLNSEFLESEIS